MGRGRRRSRAQGRERQQRRLTELSYNLPVITLVLLPGMDGTGLFFTDFAAAAGREFRPVIVAYPNDPALRYPELEFLARAALPRGEPFLVLGESFSGPIAISIAASGPRNLVGLILCVTFARNPHPLLPAVTGILRPLPAMRVPAFIQHRSLFGRFDSPRLRAGLREVRSRVSAKTLQSRLEAVAGIDVTEKLRSVAVPILCLRAARDRVVSARSCEYIRKIRPDARVVDFDAPHLLLQTVPQDALTAIRDFVHKRVVSAP